MKTTGLLGRASLVLLTVTPALRLNVFSPYESFELRRFLYALTITSVVAALISASLFRWSHRGRPWVFGVAGVLMLCLFNWPSFNTAGEFAARFVGEFLGHAVLPVALAAGLIVLAVRLSGEMPFHVLLFLAGLAIAGSQVALVVQRPAVIDAARAPDLEATPSPAAPLPDVFVIVVDAYARADVLAEELGFDNSEFLGFLKDRDFTVQESARSNYDSTYASLASLLGMGYFVEAGPPGNTDMSTVRGLIRGDGPAVDFFKSAGYDFVYVESPWGISACGTSVDVCFPYWTLGKTAQWLTEFTIFAELTSIGSWTDSADYALQQFDTLQELAASPASSPRLIYAHVGVPHPPFLLDAQCERWDNPNAGEWRIALASDPYLDQLRCVNRRLQELVETIDRADADTVVWLTSDHGIALHDQFATPPEAWNPAYVDENTAILSAYRLPADCQNPMAPDLDVVNSLRLTIDCLFDQNLGNLPGRYFHVGPPTRQPVDIVEITDLAP